MDGLDFYIANVSDIAKGSMNEMYHLYSQYYDCTNQVTFRKDLKDKNKALIITHHDQIVGFSTILQYQTQFKGKHLQIIYSGDTIMKQQYWGNPILAFAWLKFAGTAKAEYPTLPLYWFIIVKGHRTYRYLPVFSKQYFPNHHCTTPRFEQDLIDQLAHEKFGSYYNKDKGIIHYNISQGQLKTSYAAIPENLMRRKEIAFFYERNPGYTEGDELVCLCELDTQNLKPLAKRIFLEGYQSISCPIN